ncbi:hypothetical protein DOTSEDRAFT_39368 [Dothistroma septosporum NZE10]|uniref:Uncharacterized protein n=1 Tax=Dothistroma septosporum (strain NZE10 / CBS 128990) TaxID=675120 RepID=N1PBP7_DOTSN|nr:hypothetical protein DOTSEDRAFT_39368 [Dothistroma septosporum NZE10]
MCWQGFKRFHCGHAKLIEQECEHARELDLPFWLKVDCPHYTISHHDAGIECGAGRFYCAKTPDGRYLDMVFDQKARAEHRLTQLDSALRDKLGPWEDAVKMQMEQQYAHQHEAYNAFAKHPHILKIKSLRHDVHQERQNVCAKLRDADSALYYASEFFKLNTYNTTGERSRLPGYLRQFGQAQATVQPRRSPHNRWPTNTYHGQSNIVGATRALQQKAQVQATHQARRASERTPPVEAPVRRSARGKKQVNYAEDELSEPSSSERASPVAPASSLKDMILEQRQRDAARLKTAKQPAPQDSPTDGSSTPDTIVLRHPGGSPSPQMPHTYDKLRESFAKQVNLTPTTLTPPIRTNPSTVQYTVPTAMMGSPLKRKVLSSPALPSNKRLRLDWPSEEGASPLSASSPLPYMKIERTDSVTLEIEDMDPFQQPKALAAPMTEPVIAPSMQLAALHDSKGSPQAWEQQRSDASPHSDIKTYEEDVDEKFDFSDIDWDDNTGA